jgi:hypothetical protein
LNKLAKYIMAFVASLLAAVGILHLWPSHQNYISDREQRAALEYYEKNLTEGMTRGQVQTFIDSHQSQQLSMLFVLPPAPGSISIALGEVPRPLYCNRAIAYLQFNFNALQRDSRGHPTVTGIDNFTDVRLRKELQDCL